MSLVIVACDRAQAIAISDGRAFSIVPEKKLIRDDWSKVWQLGPRLCLAATGNATLSVAQDVAVFVAQRMDSSGLFRAVLEFLQDWCQRELHSENMLLALFGWDDRLGVMRVVMGQQKRFFEVRQPAENLPMHMVLGKTDSVGALTPETFAVSDPLRVMREIAAEVAARDPDIGPRTFEYLVQAPDEVLRSATRWRVWPELAAAKFTARLNADPPADLTAIAVQTWVRMCRDSGLGEVHEIS